MQQEGLVNLRAVNVALQDKLAKGEGDHLQTSVLMYITVLVSTNLMGLVPGGGGGGMNCQSSNNMQWLTVHWTMACSASPAAPCNHQQHDSPLICATHPCTYLTGVPLETVARYEAQLQELTHLVRFYEKKLGPNAAGPGASAAGGPGGAAEGDAGTWLLEELVESGAAYLWDRRNGRVYSDAPEGRWPKLVGEWPGISVQ